ncbi:hypothetical protein WB44_04325 [Synechococcus sp. WH 8020]|uniref:hypothetical protein n=1 Tax=Synechococcus sp. (strain WH8020) TaxID=32052 RepID=UPI000652720D|nr:hypothetical protein [Synechococcus sp. WH 8020]AKN60469.1 hypothetical protein WB44_04325 [Synechococcus sp. WH 8020]
MLIYLCLSSHGFGHAARQATVLSALHRLQPTWRLVVSSLVSADFLKLACGDVPVEQRFVGWDVGMIQADALGVDQDRTLSFLMALDRSLPHRLDQESAWLAEQQTPVVVVGDIPPSAAVLAERIGAPLVWMGNFGWDDIYEPLGGLFTKYAAAARAHYQQGELLLRCPFSLAMDWGLKEQELGVTVSGLRELPRPLSHHLEQIQQPLVLVGFGGLGVAIDPALFRLWPNHHFLMPAPVAPQLHAKLEWEANVTLLPQSVRPFDVMPYCDRHLGKPGYSTFCEALSQELGMHVVERDGFAEASVLMDGLRRFGNHRILSRDAFAQGEWGLDQPLIQPIHPMASKHGAEDAAKALALIASSTVQYG